MTSTDQAPGKLVKIDPALKRTSRKLRAAVAAGLPKVLLHESKYFAVSLQFGAKTRIAAKRNGVTPLLVLDGPTSITASRVPGSLVLIPLKASQDPSDVATGDLAAAVVRTVASEIEKHGSDSGHVDLWRQLDLSSETAGEDPELSPESRFLETWIRGLAESTGKPGFWDKVAGECGLLGVQHDQFLQCILSRFTVWFSPYTAKPIDTDTALGIYQTVRSHWQSNSVPTQCYGAQYWNHPSIQATFSGKGGGVAFHETQEEALSAAVATGGASRIISWAGRTDAAFEQSCADRNIRLVRIEDGFLRSVGLGAGLARGAMLAVDDLGIYYDPSRPSRLEVLLKTYDLSDAERKRGQELVDLIVSARVSKYNFGKPKFYDFPANRKVVLVPGQVADDAAIRKSKSRTIDCEHTPNVNEDLLRLARERNPDAYLVFKPHPDVETGLRKGKVPKDVALQYADDIAEDANIIDLIDLVDEIETFSSLSGFEALLRGKTVVVHGAPFYAGWGLSQDLTSLEGRGRKRTLPELVYLALVQYARTIDPVTLLPCSPEFLVSRLQEQSRDRRHLLVSALKRHSSWLGRKLGL